MGLPKHTSRLGTAERTPRDIIRRREREELLHEMWARVDAQIADALQEDGDGDGTSEPQLR